MKKKINKEIIIIAIISVLFLMMSIVYADYLYNSNQVNFNNTNTTLSSTDVQSAIDELYNKCSNIPEEGTCPEGYECTQLNKVIFKANGGTFTGGKATNNVYYNFIDGDPIEKISKTSNVDDQGNKTGYMPYSTGTTDTVQVEGAESLEVEITYQTSSSSSYVYVRNKDGNNISSKLYGTTKTTTTIQVSGDTVKFYFYNNSTASWSNNYLGYYAKVKGKKDGKYIAPLNLIKEEGEYSEPTKKDNYKFLGWTENADGSGSVYKTEEEVKNLLDTENKSVLLYAKYAPPICKRATTLHTETCSYTSASPYYCYSDGYYSNGSQSTTTITYGTLGTSGQEPTVGDAFDCDVNGDGEYDAEAERFYYVSDYYDTQSKTVNNDYAVLIYFSNIYNGKVDASHSVYWTSNQYLSAGPIEARYYLPTISQWRDDLLKTRTRNIFGVRDVTQSDIMNPSSKLSDFSYEGYAARLLTLQELYNGCYDGVTDITTSAGIKSKCQFLLEKTRYSTSSYATYGSWLETVAIIGNNSNSDAWQVNGYLSHGTANSTSYVGTRPVIEVAKTDISY